MKYKLIKHWITWTGGTSKYYIAEQIAKAINVNAPSDALFETWIGEGPENEKKREWVCLSDLEPDHKFRIWLSANNLI